MLPLPDIRPTTEYIQGRLVSVLARRYDCDYRGIRISIPKGFKSDCSSVPRCLHWFISPTDPGFIQAGVVHDWLYRHGPYTRAMADLLFYELLRECGVSWLKANCAYYALRWFGKRNFTTFPLLNL
jgi:hypothetical protein